MPGRNLARLFAPDSYYHVYNRGVNRGKIFIDKEDYEFFSALFGRYLSFKPQKDNKGREYLHLANELQILAYCWMPNHFHLLIYQSDSKGMLRLMMSVATAYTVYFNKKYKRSGPLFENNYRASLISNDSYLQHISRYIHLNPAEYRTWAYSSYAAYTKNDTDAEWVHPQPILDLFDSADQYRQFVADYEDAKKALDEMKVELADTRRLDA